MGKLVYMYWDCQYCGTKGILGDKRECPHCGHPRDVDISFYLKPQQVTYVEEEKAKKVSRNPDWLCSFCDCLNSDDDLNCKSCGASKAESERNYFENKRKREAKKEERSAPSSSSSPTTSFPKPTSSSSSIASQEKYSSTSGFSSSQKKSASSSLSVKTILFVLLGILLVAGLVYLIIPKSEVLTVQDVSWKYTISIETLKTFDESDWHVPDGARIKDLKQELHHYDNVLDHYETKTRQVQKQRLAGYEEYVSGYRDLGNGYAEEIISKRPVYETYYDTETYQDPVYRKEPVYQTKYYYEIDRWVPERNVTTSGNDKNPYWGNVILADNERVGTKADAYFVDGINPSGKEFHFAISKDDFAQIEVGNVYEFSIRFEEGKLVQK